MMTTTAPPWLRRSDQAITWARTMLKPHHAVVIDCETTDLPGAICEVAVVDTRGRSLLSTLVNPRRPISAAATRVHNITDAPWSLAYLGCLLYTSPSPRDGLLS